MKKSPAGLFLLRGNHRPISADFYSERNSA
jgi:hypothetical protein